MAYDHLIERRTKTDPELTRLIEQIEEMATRVGAVFVVDPDKLKIFVAARRS
jgi:ribosomal protein S2